MPVTTYRDYPLPQHHNNEIQKMLEELSQHTNREWFCEVGWKRNPSWNPFSKPALKTHTIMKYLGGNEYQILTCTNTEGECLAYLYGACGIIDGA